MEKHRFRGSEAELDCCKYLRKRTRRRREKQILVKLLGIKYHEKH
jgi:hypothetical protein